MSLLEKAKEQKKRKKIEKASEESEVLSGEKHAYSTGVDALYQLVQKSGKISFKNASGSLQVHPEDIETWASILAKEGLVTLKYPPLGSPEILKKGEGQEYKKFRHNTATIFSSKKPAAIGILFIIVASALGIFLFQGKEQMIATSDKEEEIPEESVSFEEAFSGQGNYRCSVQKEDVDSMYYIQNKTMRVETLYSGVASVILYYKGYLYTYLAQEDKWYKSKPKEDVILPGTNNKPSNATTIICYRIYEVNDTLFALDPAKVVL